MHEPVRGGGGGGSSGLTGQRNTAQRVDGGAMRGVAGAEDTSAHISFQLRWRLWLERRKVKEAMASR